MHGAGDGIEYEQALDPAVENTANAREPHALTARPSQDLRQKAWLREEPGLCCTERSDGLSLLLFTVLHTVFSV